MLKLFLNEKSTGFSLLLLIFCVCVRSAVIDECFFQSILSAGAEEFNCFFSLIFSITNRKKVNKTVINSPLRVLRLTEEKEKVSTGFIALSQWNPF